MVQKMLTEYLSCLGVSLIGFADLNDVDTTLFNNMKYGISIAIAINPNILNGLSDGPTEEYYEEFIRLNEKLNTITKLGVKHIISMGYNAIGQTSTYETRNANLTTILSHKTVATKAGLGWIGKNALLTTTKYGSAIRLSSIITDMDLETGTPITESKCGCCNKCVEICPGSALTGNNWSLNSKREDLIDAFNCRDAANSNAKKLLGIEMPLCGKCMVVCPFTKRYVNSCV